MNISTMIKNSANNKTQQKPDNRLSSSKSQNKSRNLEKTTAPIRKSIEHSLKNVCKRIEQNIVIRSTDIKNNPDEDTSNIVILKSSAAEKNRNDFQIEQALNYSIINTIAKHIVLNAAAQSFVDKTTLCSPAKQIAAKKLTNKFDTQISKRNVTYKPKVSTLVANTPNVIKTKHMNAVDKNIKHPKQKVLTIQPKIEQLNRTPTENCMPSPIQNTKNNQIVEKKCNLANGKSKVLNLTATTQDIFIFHEKFQLLINEYVSNHSKYKCLASESVNRNEIFTIVGHSNAIKISLSKRGWSQKLTEVQDTNLKTSVMFENAKNVESKFQTVIVSKLLKKYQPSFIWFSRNEEKSLCSSNHLNSPLINRLKMEDKYFTTKRGLCSSLQNKYWFYIEGVSEVNAPRSYNVFAKEELNTFLFDYRLTACTSLLKWFVRSQRNTKIKLISKDGKISLSTVFFALKRCQKYIYYKQHMYIDKIFKNPKNMEWDDFIENYNKLINNCDHFMIEDKPVFHYYLELSYAILHELQKYRPQLNSEGLYNVWIVKPAQQSRGKGITLQNQIQKILETAAKAGVNKYVVQKYIEMPLLIHGTKFDIRQYFIVTSTYPLIIWMYKNCYLRFCSQIYRLDNFHESIHLTNNAVQRKYKNSDERHPNLPANNMWSLLNFKSHLEGIGHPAVWDSIIYPEMKRNVIGAMLSCQDGMIRCKNRFELYGSDFLLDDDYKPWLLEINSSPDMSSSTDVTAKICPETLEDVIKVVLDYNRNSKSPTGHFECIYKQKMTNGKTGLDVSTMMACGVQLSKKYFCKLENVSEPQYEKAGITDHATINMPLKHDIGILQSDSDIIQAIPSAGETMVYQYRKTSSQSVTENSEESQHKINNEEFLETSDENNDSIQNKPRSRSAEKDKIVSKNNIIVKTSESTIIDMALDFETGCVDTMRINIDDIEKSTIVLHECEIEQDLSSISVAVSRKFPTYEE